jgi:hypothetical protein
LKNKQTNDISIVIHTFIWGSNLKTTLLAICLLIATGCGQTSQPQSNQIENPAALESAGSDASLELHTGHLPAWEHGGAWGSTGQGLNQFFHYVYVFHDREYLEALRLEAEAALLAAQAQLEREQSRAEALRLLIEETGRQLAMLRAELKSIDAKIATIRLHERSLSRLDAEAMVEASTMTALQFFAQLTRQPMGRFLQATVDRLPSEAFRSRGTVRVVTTPDGRKVFESTSGPAPEFGGGTAEEYLQFLRDHRLKAVHASAKAPLRSVLASVYEAGGAALAALADQQSAIRQQSESRWSELSQMLTQLEQQKSAP